MTFFLDWPLILRIPHFIYLLLFCPPPLPPWGTVLLYLRKKRPKNFPLCIYSMIYSDWDTLTVFARYHWQQSIAQVVFLEASTEILFLFHKDIFIFHKDFFTKKCHYLLWLITDSLLCQLIGDIINMAYYIQWFFQFFTHIDCLKVGHFYLHSKFLSLRSEKHSCWFLSILSIPDSMNINRSYY